MMHLVIFSLGPHFFLYEVEGFLHVQKTSQLLSLASGINVAIIHLRLLLFPEALGSMSFQSLVTSNCRLVVITRSPNAQVKLEERSEYWAKNDSLRFEQ